MKKLINCLFVLLFACCLTACVSGGKPAIMIDHYSLEYLPPASPGLTAIDAVIGIERFSAAQTFNNVRMIYRQKPNLYNDYAYSRWRANPADMIGDSLFRDLQAAGIFRGVFSYRDNVNTPYLLRGGVREFYESDDQEGRKAILSVHITLFDTTQKELTRQILFQKKYYYEEPVKDKTVQGFAQAMSKAAQKLSEQIVLDIYAAIKNQMTEKNRG